jgi:2'-5' RNA ligase
MNELKQFDSGRDYVPHMTVGKVSSTDVLDKAFDDANRYKNKFSTTVSKISVEMIGEHEESIIIIEQDLN